MTIVLNYLSVLNLCIEVFDHEDPAFSGRLAICAPNDEELNYCKIAFDGVFGKKKFVNRTLVEASPATVFSTVNLGFFKYSVYILWYSKHKSYFIENSVRVPQTSDYAYNKWLENPECPFLEWRLGTLTVTYSVSPQLRSRWPDSVLIHFHKFKEKNSSIFRRLASISYSGTSEAIVKLKRKSMGWSAAYLYKKNVPLINLQRI